MTIYVFDANVFIDANNIFYDMNVFPAFWDWLILQNQRGNIVSIDKIFEELCEKEDNLAEWARQRDDNFFVASGSVVVKKYSHVSSWANASNYTRAAIHEFLDDAADSWLIAHALASGYIVVTHEVPGSDNEKIKIPDVCADLRVKCMNLFDMLRRVKPKFILEN